MKTNNNYVLEEKVDKMLNTRDREIQISKTTKKLTVVVV